MAEQGSPTTECVKQYTDERQLLVQNEFKLYGDFDKLVSGIGAGALGVSAAFIKDLVPLANASCKPLLAAGWAVLSIAIVASLSSIWASAHAHRAFLKALDGAALESGLNGELWYTAREKQAESVFPGIVHVLNAVSLLGILLGLSLLIAFVSINITK